MTLLRLELIEKIGRLSLSFNFYKMNLLFQELIGSFLI